MEKPERIIFILNESRYSVVITVCTMPSILKNLFFLLLKQQNQRQHQQKTLFRYKPFLYAQPIKKIITFDEHRYLQMTAILSNYKQYQDLGKRKMSLL